MARNRGFIKPGHGKGGSTPHVELSPADELPVGRRAPTCPVPARDDAGQLLPGPGTRELARKAGKASAMSRQLGKLLGLAELDEGHPFAPYARLAREWRDQQMASVAATVGGGEVSPGVASIISTAALQMGASRWAMDQGAQNLDAKALLEFSKLADASRQNILAAHQLAATEAKSRPTGPFDPLAAFRRPEDSR